MVIAATAMHQNQFPTLDRLGVQLSATEQVDSPRIASKWFDFFAQSLESADAQSVRDLLLPNAFWRDMLSLTWEFRTFYGGDVLNFLNDRLPSAKISKVSLDGQSIQLARPMPDMAWIQASFTFETKLGICSGIVRLMPTSSGEWKAYTVYTNLEDLHGHQEKVGKHREQEASHGTWQEKRRKEIECDGEDEQPTVLIIGAGQCGLVAAARLKYLGVKSLVIERDPRIGHGWRSHYEALRLHDTVYFEHLPYLPFPSTWPVTQTPAQKARTDLLADWLEHYADALELNVWTSTKISKIEQDPKTHHWSVKLQRGDGNTREFTFKYVVGAIGFSSGKMIVPDILGKSDFQGEVLHSTSFRTARDYIGKRVVVVGAANSAHDICSDLYDHGVDVTMIQRSSTNILTFKGLQTMFGALYNEDRNPDVGDRELASFPRWAGKELTQRIMSYVAESIDKELLDDLHKVGFRTNRGEEDCGPLFQAFRRIGGFYIDVGGSRLVADGKIKLKSDSPISRFTKTGLEFDNGSKLDADAVVYATGFSFQADAYREILGEELGKKLNPMWGLDAESEQKTLYRDSGIPHFWMTFGSLATCRFHSKHLALQIKAMEEGLWDGKRYSLQE